MPLQLGNRESGAKRAFKKIDSAKVMSTIGALLLIFGAFLLLLFVA
jgi:hypothetical protein